MKAGITLISIQPKNMLVNVVPKENPMAIPSWYEYVKKIK